MFLLYSKTLCVTTGYGWRRVAGRQSSVDILWISCGQYVDIYRVAVDKYKECSALCVRLCAFCVRSVFCSGTVDSRQALARLASGRS